ncbi:ester cyclase [Dickeya zeae]|uniref:Ester cyclase n=1 Tax=Dickeya zeae TaxID=204042 RepID=A0ABX8VUK2_9GAMM|nr:ester cyclase [Dickeya zeae]QYM91599.1 ester cyclase [Dickeya zeae]
MDRRSLLVGMGLTLTGFTGQVLSRPVTNTQKSPVGQQLINQFAETLSAHNIDAFAALFAETYINHQMSAAAPIPMGVTPKQASVGIFAARLKGLPDLKVTVEMQVVSNDMVAASFIYEGTHTGVYLGVPATNRRLRFTSCDIFRVVDGKFVEHWGMGDLAGVMAQLKG